MQKIGDAVEFREALELTFSVLGGLGIFLLGMKNMSEGMQAVAGEKLRLLISAVTSNRFVACIVGTLVTMTIQSSSVTTVTVVGMVNAGVMTLQQSVGVILGANIGTTITAWIMTLKIGAFGLPLLGASAFVYLFSKRERLRYAAMALLGLGMVFYGLELMKDGFEPLRYMPEVRDWFARFRADSFFGRIQCVLVGALITAVIQSSSATIGITLSLVGTGLIDFDSAAALVLGENIGTTVTAYLASLGASTSAKRAAYAHILINVLGALWVILLFNFYIGAVRWALAQFGVYPDVHVLQDGAMYFEDAESGVPLTHTAFNIVNVLVFLPLVGFITRLLERIAPEKRGVVKPHLTYLDVRMLDSPAIGIQQSRNEVLRMARTAEEMLLDLRTMMASGDVDEDKARTIFDRENELDAVQKEVMQFLGDLLSGNVPHAVMGDGRGQLRMADEYETISDYVVNLLKLRLRMQKHGYALSEEGAAQLLALLDRTVAFVQLVNEAVREEDSEILERARTEGASITRQMKQTRSFHLARVESGEISPLVSLIYTDMLNACRRIKDHGVNIAEVLSGEK